MKKVLFILQKKHYTSQLMSYIKTLKLIWYEIHIFTDMEDEFEYCDKQQKCNFNILRLENYTRKIKDYAGNSGTGILIFNVSGSRCKDRADTKLRSYQNHEN